MRSQFSKRVGMAACGLLAAISIGQAHAALPISATQVTDYDGLPFTDSQAIPDKTVIDDISYDGWQAQSNVFTSVFPRFGGVTNDVNTTKTRFYTSDGTEFEFISITFIRLVDGIPTATVTFHAFKDGVKTGEQTESLPQGQSARIPLTVPAFQSVDEVRVTSDGAPVYFDNLEVGTSNPPVPTSFSVGGTLSQTGSPIFPGSPITLSLLVGPNKINRENLSLDQVRPYVFNTKVNDGEVYEVVVNERALASCLVSNGSGMVSGADVVNVDVDCEDKFVIGATISGLDAGKSLTVEVNNADPKTITGTGLTPIGTTYVAGTSYSVTVSQQPVNETCTVVNGSGTISANVFDVKINCKADTYTVGGTVTGLAAGNEVVLQENGAETAVVTSSTPGGAFTFSPIANGTAYAVTVKTQPTSPNQFCRVLNGVGTVTGSNVTNANVECVTRGYTIGGSITGLANGASVLLQSASPGYAIEQQSISADGQFSFSAVDDGTAYTVTVATPPVGQTCSVVNGSGTLAGSSVNNVQVNCQPVTFEVGGTVSGLASGATLELSNNGANPVKVNANGDYRFPAQSDGSRYDVHVTAQPTVPNQVCTVSNGSGPVSGAAVTNIDVNCVTDKYAVGGHVTGLVSGDTLVLRNNGSDPLTITQDGAFAFSAPLDDRTQYNATVGAQPAAPSETCTVTNGVGLVAGQAVDSIKVTCSLNTFTVGGQVTGLDSNASVVITNNGADSQTVTGQGSTAFTFTAQADGSMFAVGVKTQPNNPSQTCSVTSGGSGTLAGADINSVAIACVTTQYTVGGVLSGLVPGENVVLQNNAGDDKTLTADGPFSFATSIDDGQPYAVSILTDPRSETCQLTNETGVVAGGNVANVSVACASNTYTVGGSVQGLSAGKSLELTNNGGDNLTVGASGSFVFSAPIADLTGYDVQIATQPAGETCTVSNGSGTLAGANVSSVAVSCVDNTVTIPVAGSNPAGVGATLTIDGCSAATASFIAAPASPSRPPLYSYPYGLVDFTGSNCDTTPGGITVTIDYAQALPAGAVLFKEEGANNDYSPFPGTIAGSKVTYVLSDNGSGEEDPTPGAISDPAGPGVPLSSVTPPTAPGAQAIPALPLLWLGGLILTLGVVGARAKRQRP